MTAEQDVLRVRVRDDGRGGADFSRGSGLTGLKDRVEAVGGRISLRSQAEEQARQWRSSFPSTSPRLPARPGA